MRVKQAAVIEKLESDSSNQLLRLGLAPGRQIEVLKTGTRFLISVAGSRLALDAALASQVYVSKIA